jgi:6-phosphogluconolactonase
VEILVDPDAVARRAARLIAEAARAALAARGRFVLAVSGGRTPRLMLRYLAEQELLWDGIYVVQVDERVAPAGHPDRNLTHLRESLAGHSDSPATPQAESRLELRPGLRPELRPGLRPEPRGRLRPERRLESIVAMPVEEADLAAAAGRYALELERIAGSPPVLDLVHLGLGADGHTASLVPGDPALDVDDADVAVTGVYQGRRRMTLTYPIIDRSRGVLWVVTGSEKAHILARLRAADPTIPAGRVAQGRAIVVADRSAAEALKAGAD